MLSLCERLDRLREQLRSHSIDAYVIPTDDAHSSEYPPESDARRAYISGFTGSAGTAVVTQTEAKLWTDGRYYSQAHQQLDPTYWALMKDVEAPTIAVWLKENDKIQRVGYDPSITSIASYSSIHSVLSELQPPKGFCPIQENLVDLIWQVEGRPPCPASCVDVLGIEHTGMSVEAKLSAVREQLQKERVHGVVLSRLDDVAWVTNARASDIAYCPVFVSYMYISTEHARLYVDSSRLSVDASKHMEDNKIDVRAYDQIFIDLQSLYRNPQETFRLWLDRCANMKLYNSVDDPKKRIFLQLSPVQLPKAIKNKVELDGMKEAHIKDAIAECTFLAWLEDLADTNEAELKTYTEWTVAEILDNLRKQMRDNRGLSFSTISGIGPNGAVIHYKPEESTALHLSRALYLVDSGGQYLQGTTDITRTLHLGTPTDIETKCYTLVLKGHLQLARQTFPKGTKGTHLDCLARQYLWLNGLNYAHGTGHGVGSYLNVHEGPHGIRSPTLRLSEETSLEPGMIVSNEPGYYKDGQFGIRIENLMFVKKIDVSLNDGLEVDEFYGFEDLTLVPHHKKLIDVTMLTDEEILQLNAYHQHVESVMTPRINACTNLKTHWNPNLVLAWLAKATSPLGR